MPGNFIDTNILAYLASHDVKKLNDARRVVSFGGTISVQVLNELTNVARRKMRLSWQETRDLLASVRVLLTVVPMTIAIHESGLSLYDAMIVAAALGCACDTLWSEDVQHDLLIHGTLRIRNPFLLPPSGAAV